MVDRNYKRLGRHQNEGYKFNHQVGWYESHFQFEFQLELYKDLFDS